MAEISSIVTVRSRRQPVLVCRKCLKRVPNGHRIKQALKAEVKRTSGTQHNWRPRVVLTSCFGICPKRAVVVTGGTTLHRSEYVLLADADQATDAVALLMPPDRA